jgi:hypothetical protein
MERFKASAPAQLWFFSSGVTLGICRVLLALLLLGDVLRRWTDLDVWYTNQGLMPNHTMLWAPQMRLGFSIFYSVSQLHEARFFVVLIIFVYLGLLVGWRTKLFQILAMLAHVSLDCRVHYVTNGGDVALSVLLLWACFLPLGSWLSIDSLRRSMKHSRLKVLGGEGTLEVPKEHEGVLAPPSPQFLWAAGAIAAQLAVIYFFNFVHKDGPGWAEGRVLLDVFNQNRIATAIAVWVRPYLTADISLVMTRAVQGAEASLPLLVLLPVKTLRRLAILVGFSLHAGFALFINLGVFSETMMMTWLFLLPHEDVAWFLRKVLGPRKDGPVKVGASRWAAHAVACMQHRGVSALPAFVPRGVEWLAVKLKLDAVEPEAYAPDPPLKLAMRTWTARVGSVLLAYVTAAFVVQTLAQNRWVPQQLKPTPPTPIVWLVEYLHFYQGWGMFAVSPREDWTVVVRATTADGRTVDPLSERSSARSAPAIHEITDRLDHDEYWCDYLSRISGDRAYEPPLRDWILAYPQRTGNPNDAIRSFDVIEVKQTSPWYGQTEGTNRTERVLMKYP